MIHKLSEVSPFKKEKVRWISFQLILREKQERDKNLEKKRKISREREKSQKKREFFQKRFFSRENSLFHFLSTSNAFSTFLNYSNSSNTSNASIFMFDHSSPRIFREKCVKREFSLGKETFLWKKFLLKKFSFSEIFLFLFVSL